MTIQSHVISLTSNGAGAATGSVRVSGKLIQMIIIPGLTTSQPTDQFDIAVTDDYSTAIFTDTGVGNAANEVFFPWITTSGTKTDSPYCVVGNLNVVAAGMGDIKTAKIVFFVEGN